jgi:16S rRNA processing protein RimM
LLDKRDDLINIGRVLGPWGVKGKIKIAPLTDFPERFNPGQTLYCDAEACVIESTDWHRGNALVKITGVDTIVLAERFTGKYVTISPSQIMPLPTGRFYHFQIIGLVVITADGREIGPVTAVLNSAASDIYAVKGQDGEILIPATDATIKTIDLEKKIMIIEPVPGLLELNKKAAK